LRNGNSIKQTNIKQINRIAQHQRHHLVVLDAQISKHLSNPEVRANSALLFNVSQAQIAEQKPMTTYGYARVSTDGQSIQAQTEALQGCGCARIFAEKISGAYSDRP